MANLISPQPAHNLTAELLPITGRLTIGSTVCITEGLIAALAAMLPHNQWMYAVGLLLAFATWLGFWRFRNNKLGADIADLCFYEMLGWGLALALYQAGHNPANFWFFFTGIFALKIIRVYIWQRSATQQFGWGQFGPLTRRYARLAASTTPTPWKKLAGEILLALLAAAIICIAIRHLNDFWRVAVVWIVPLSFEIIYGPQQLQNMALLDTQLKTSTQAAHTDDGEAQEMRQTIAALRKQQQQQADAQPDEALALIIEAYYKADKMKRGYMLDLAQAVAASYPESDDSPA